MQVTPSQLVVGRRVGRRHDSPVNMAAVYRQSLMSPDPVFREKARGNVFSRGGAGGNNQYRLVLSERHKILRHYMGKASGKR